MIEAFAITLLHMGIWLVFGIIHEKSKFMWSIEYVIRFLTRKKQSNEESE